MSIITYRPDIDGLRAVAILPVVLFHLGIAGVSGGFVGVDIFFVISGFLITSIIHREMQMDTFSMKQFWVRRARRILPAMFVLITFTLAAGWFLLAPHDYAELGKSARYQALFAANIFFWQESGYFDTAAELKPLLHMWSLAVEEQFYFVFPLLLLLLRPVTANTRLYLLSGIALSSFIFSAWSVYQYPSATFYLLPMRAWELMLGSLIVFLPKDTVIRPVALNSLSIMGSLAIVFSIVFYDAQLTFPGPTALLPTLGAAVIIWAGPNTVVARLLASRPTVFIGLLSYSWYLWHWPLIVFARYWHPEPLALTQQAGLFMLSLLLAYASCKLVETPFRKKIILGSDKKILSAAFTCILLTVMLGQHLRVNEGYPERLPQIGQQYESARHRDKEMKSCEFVSAEDVSNNKLCPLEKNNVNKRPGFVTWGDSHNASLLPLYRDMATRHHINGVHSAHIACPPFPGLEWKNKPSCNRYNLEMLAFIKRSQIPDVILAARWNFYLDGDNSKDWTPITSPDNISNEDYYAALLDNTIKAIRATGANVWIIKQVPSQPFEAPKHLALLSLQGKNTVGLGKSYTMHIQEQTRINRILDNAAQQPGVYVIDPTNFICRDKKVCRTEEDGWALYRDDNHLTPLGARELEPMMSAFIQHAASYNENKR